MLTQIFHSEATVEAFFIVDIVDLESWLQCSLPRSSRTVLTMGHPGHSSLGLLNYEKLLFVMQGLETELVPRRVMESQKCPPGLQDATVDITPDSPCRDPQSHPMCNPPWCRGLSSLNHSWNQSSLNPEAPAHHSLELVIRGWVIDSFSCLRDQTRETGQLESLTRILNQNASQVWESDLWGTNCPPVIAGTPVNMQPCEQEQDCGYF